MSNKSPHTELITKTLQALADLQTVRDAGCPHEVRIEHIHTLKYPEDFDDSYRTLDEAREDAINGIQATITDIMGWWATETATERYSVQPAGDGTWVVRLHGNYMPVSVGHDTPLAAHLAVLRAIAEQLNIVGDTSHEKDTP